jgi:hypothetical protein
MGGEARNGNRYPLRVFDLNARDRLITIQIVDDD